MLLIAFAAVSARWSRCSSIISWNACCAPPHASTICRRPSPFLARISYWPRASASSFAKIAPWPAPSASMRVTSGVASASTICFAFDAFATASSSARFSCSILIASAWAALASARVLRLAHAGVGLALARLAASGTPRPRSRAASRWPSRRRPSPCSRRATALALASATAMRICPLGLLDLRLLLEGRGPLADLLLLLELGDPHQAARARRPCVPISWSLMALATWIGLLAVGLGDADRAASSPARRRRSGPAGSRSTPPCGRWPRCSPTRR